VKSRSFAWAILLVLLSPFLILLLSIFLSPTLFIEPSQTYHRLMTLPIAHVFLLNTVQALLSSALAMIFGIFGAYGFIFASMTLAERLTVPAISPFSIVSLRASVKLRMAIQSFEAFILLPNLAPVLLLILAAMKYLPRMQGLWGIVILHALLNLGLVAISVVRMIHFRLERLLELSLIEGVGKFKFFIRVLLPILKNDLLALGLFVFAICFSSFAIPLMMGGSRAVTVEVLIYQTMRVDGDLASALFMALLQMVAVVALAVFLPKSGDRQGLSQTMISMTTNLRASARGLVSSPFGLLFLLAPPLLIVASLFDGFLKGVAEFTSLQGLHAEIFEQFAGSIFVGAMTALLVSGLLMALTWVEPQGRLRTFFLGFAAPSSVLTGLSLIIVWRGTGFASLIKVSIALALIFTPAFYRMQWDALLGGLGAQVRIAQTLGASQKMIFWEVLMPQLWPPLGSLAGLASLWAWGDFALSSVIAERQLTLAMAAQSLMDSYRLDVATVYIWMIAMGGLISYVFFKGAGRVLGSKSEL